MHTGNILYAESISLDTPGKINRLLNYYLQINPKEYIYKLKNGLKIIVIPDSRFKIARVQIIYYVGANDEYTGITGISHVVEHMLFRGTEHHSGAEYDQLFTSADANAITDREYTTYYTTTNIDNLPQVFELEADRMKNALFDLNAFKNELEVVKEEQRQRANVDTILYNRVMASANITNGLHNPTIGWIHDLNKMTVKKAKSWYQKWYQPNNATILICGNVEPSKIFKLAESYFGSIPTKPISRQDNSDIDFIGKKTIEIHFPRAVPSVKFFYTLPVHNFHELAAINALWNILNLKLTKKTPYFTSISSSLDIYQHHSEFSINANFITEDYQKRINLINSYIEALKKDAPEDKAFDITEQDLLDEKNLLFNWLISQCDSLASIVYWASWREGLQWTQTDLMQFYQESAQITLTDLHTVAKKYFIENNLTVGLVKKGDPNDPPTE